MTGLCPRRAARFFRGADFASSQAVTAASGIAALVPGSDIDDYVFEPCGYSMNGMQPCGAFSTIHITPEDGFSYASFELCGYSPAEVDAGELVRAVVGVFGPRSVSVALSSEGAAGDSWRAPLAPPPAYEVHSASFQELKCGGGVAFLTLEAGDGPAAAAAAAAGPPLQLRGKGVGGPHRHGAGAGSDSDGGSPRGVLNHFPSFASVSAAGAGGGRGGGGGGSSSASELGDSASASGHLRGSGSSCDAASDGGSCGGGGSLAASLVLEAPPHREHEEALGFEEVLALYRAAPLQQVRPSSRGRGNASLGVMTTLSWRFEGGGRE